MEGQATGSAAVSRRGFLGWGAAMLTAAAIPAGVLVLTETAAAGLTTSGPYSLTTWQALLQRSVVATGADGVRHTLKVTAVNDRTVASTQAMSGDAFNIGFGGRPLAPGTYAMSGSGLHQAPLFIDGTRASFASINNRVPT